MLHTSTTSVTFAVDDVTRAHQPLLTRKPLEVVRNLIDAPDTRFPPDESSQGNPTHGRVEACWSYSLDCVAGVWHHPLIAAAHLAFSQHRPLVLSPDVIWVTIAQGLAQHLRLDPEKHRHLLVRHEGRKTLTLLRDDLHRRSPENPWADVVASFADLVRQEVGAFARELVCDFSTTGSVERTVSEVVLLDTLQPYFSYNLVCVCGIPEVTLEGTEADWQHLRRKVELLAPFDLDWWLRELRPICDHFARAAAGEVDREHWRQIYKIRQVYAAEIISGWLGKLFPYVRDRSGAYAERNPLFDPQVQAEILELDEEDTRNKGEPIRRFDAPGVRAEDLPRGLSRVPFTLEEPRGKVAMDFVAGPLAVTQDPQTLALRPTLGWAVREAPPIEQALLRLAGHDATPRSKSGEARFPQMRACYVPTDVMRFSEVLDGAQLHGGLYRVLPTAQWCAPEWAQRWVVVGNERVPQSGHRFRFAHTADGTEVLLCLHSRERDATGAVFVGRTLDGTLLPDTGRRVARSFTDFLLRALDGSGVPYFRREGFVPPGAPLPEED